VLLLVALHLALDFANQTSLELAAMLVHSQAVLVSRAILSILALLGIFGLAEMRSAPEKVKAILLALALFRTRDIALSRRFFETMSNITNISKNLSAQSLHSICSEGAFARLEVNDGQNARRVSRGVQAVTIALLEGGRTRTAVAGMEGAPLAVLASAFVHVMATLRLQAVRHVVLLLSQTIGGTGI